MRQRLRRYFTTPPVGLVTLFSFAMMLLAFGFIFFRIWTAEEDAADRERKAVARVFASHQTAILNEMERYAASNAAYFNIDTGFSGPWVKTRFADDMAADFPHSAAFLLSPENEVVFENVIDAGPLDLLPAINTPEIKASIAEIQAHYLADLARMPNNTGNFSGHLGHLSDIQVVGLETKIALVALFAIVPDPGGIPINDRAPYILATAHSLERPLLDRILENLALSDLHFADTVPAGMNSLPVTGATGRTKGYLYWQPMSQGIAILLSSVPLLLLFLVGITVMTVTALRRNAEAQQSLASAASQSRYDADHDHLTGLTLRPLFLQQARQLLKDTPPPGACLVYLDIAGQKHINDTWGNAAGDVVIKTFAQRIRNRIPPEHLVARWGGDEFMVLIAEPDGERDIASLMRELLASLNQPIVFEGTKIEVACNAGIAHYPEHGESIEDLARAADAALHHTKNTPVQSFSLFDPTLDASVMENRALRDELMSAVRTSQMELYYQPIVRNIGEAPVAVEALIRWNHPVHGLISPARFLPLADAAGMMPEIGRWVMERAIQDAARWPMDLGVSVNITTTQLLHPTFTQSVKQLLFDYNLPPHRLTLEITENELLDRIEETVAVQFALGELGVRFALDDFGTGYSSLSYLHLYNFDTLKIDKSFLIGHNFGENTRALLTTMINIGQVLGMSVVVEGVETEEQRAFLRQSGCGFLQGYLFARPMSYDALEEAYSFFNASPRSLPDAM